MPAARAEDLQAAGKAMLEARLQGSPLRQESPIKFDLQPTEEFEMIHERHTALIEQLDRQRQTIEQLEDENRELKSTNATLEQNIASGSSRPVATPSAAGGEAAKNDEHVDSLRQTLEQVRQNVQAREPHCRRVMTPNAFKLRTLFFCFVSKKCVSVLCHRTL